MDPLTLFLIVRGGLALLIALGGILTLRYAARLMRGRLAKRADGNPAKFEFGLGNTKLSFSSRDAGLALAFSAFAWAFAAVWAAPSSLKVANGEGSSSGSIEIATKVGSSAKTPIAWQPPGQERLARLIQVDNPPEANPAPLVVLSQALPDAAPEAPGGGPSDNELLATILEPRAAAVPTILELGESVGVLEGRIELRVEPDGTVTTVRAVGPEGQVAQEATVAPEFAAKLFAVDKALEPAQATWVQADLYRGQTVAVPQPADAASPPAP